MEDESRAEQSSVPLEPPIIPTSIPSHGARLTHISPSLSSRVCGGGWLQGVVRPAGDGRILCI